MKSLLRFVLLFIVLIVGFAALAIYWTFYKPLPNYTATISMPELQQPVQVHWDDYGVPSIFATNQNDLYTALGYVHAQDRLWQMTVSQLFVEGRFAEFLGEDVIEFDKFSRTIGFWRIAAELEQNLSGDELRMLTSYSKGINRYIADNRKSLPVEFALTGINPIEWTPRHSIALTRLLGWELNISWWTKIMVGYLETYFDEPILRELFPQWDVDGPRNLNPAETRQLLSSVIPLLNTDMLAGKMLGNQGTHVGSNAWVSSGERTPTGLPILAGDPHLGLDMPGKWYEVHLNLNGKNVSGATVAGAPLMVLGQNDHLAWTFTSLLADDTDFFIENINPENSRQYLADADADFEFNFETEFDANDAGNADAESESGIESNATFRDFRIIREIIKTSDGDEILHEIRLTQNGPIINDIYPNAPLVADQLISMRWSGYEMSNEIGALHAMAWSENMDEFRQGLDHFGVPGLNILYGDNDGNIAMFTVGNLPVRSEPSLLFRHGWDQNQRWDQFIPKNHLPRIINPEKGYIANANNPVVSDNYPYYLTSFWEPDSRIRRIEQVLNSNEEHTVPLFKSLQNDVYSFQSADITRIILPALEASDDANIEHVLAYLQNWDFFYTENATAATLMDLFFLKFVENTFRSYLGDPAYENFIKLENFPVRVTTHMLKYGSSWLQSTGGNYTYRDSLITVSMSAAVEQLRNDYGDDPSDWQWGNVHTITLSPLLFREAVADSTAPTALKMIVNNVLSRGPYPVGGHSMSVNNTQYNWEDPFGQVLGASIRRIVDLSDLSRSESILPTGQSGNPLSRHFGDQTELWISGKYRIFTHNNHIADEVRIRTMFLKP